MDDQFIIVRRVQLVFRLEPHWVTRKLFPKQFNTYDLFNDKRYNRSHFITGDQIKVTVVKKNHKEKLSLKRQPLHWPY